MQEPQTPLDGPELRSPPPALSRAAHQRLQQGRVLVVGVGGLGCPAALYLAATGVGTLGLIDGDAVELSNLHRQVAYRSPDIGQPKVLAAAERIAAFNPDIKVRPYHTRLVVENVAEIFAEFDFVIDATDGVETKYVINDAAVRSGVPFSHAGIVGFHGQTMTVLPRRSACLRCLFPSPPPEDDLPTCQQAGIIGALAGSIGVVQATEALKHLAGIGKLLSDRLLTYDAARSRWRAVALSRNPQCPVCAGCG